MSARIFAVAAALWFWLAAGSKVRHHTRLSSSPGGDPQSRGAQPAGSTQQLDIRISRPRVFENPPQYKGFINTELDYLITARVMYAHACDRRLSGFTKNRRGGGSLSFIWTIHPKSQDSPPIQDASFNTSKCHLRWQAPYEGEFHVTVVVLLRGHPSADDNLDFLNHPNSGPNRSLGISEESRSKSTWKRLATGRRDFFIRDLWITALGDSFASGQGNPDAPSKLMGIIPAAWISRKCYRSAYGSWAFRTYKYVEQAYRNHGVLFTYLACSGASITDAFLEKGSQLDKVSEIQKAANRVLCSKRGSCARPIRPDVLLMSIGGNDISYSDVLSAMISGNSHYMFRQLPGRFQELKRRMEKMGQKITEKLPGLNPKSLFYLHYFDISRNEKGITDTSCKDLHNAPPVEFQSAIDRILGRVNGMITKFSSSQNWTAVDKISDIFHEHGMCSSSPYIRTVQQSFSLQGDYFGAFHPNRIGHSRVAQRVWTFVRNFLQNRGISYSA